MTISRLFFPDTNFFNPIFLVYYPSIDQAVLLKKSSLVNWEVGQRAYIHFNNENSFTSQFKRGSYQGPLLGFLDQGRKAYFETSPGCYGFVDVMLNKGVVKLIR